MKSFLSEAEQEPVVRFRVGVRSSGRLPT